MRDVVLVCSTFADHSALRWVDATNDDEASSIPGVPCRVTRTVEHEIRECEQAEDTSSTQEWRDVRTNKLRTISEVAAACEDSQAGMDWSIVVSPHSQNSSPWMTTPVPAIPCGLDAVSAFCSYLRQFLHFLSDWMQFQHFRRYLHPSTILRRKVTHPQLVLVRRSTV